MAFMNTVQTLTGESLDEAHWPNCVAVIRVFFGLWQIKLEESTKFLRKGYLANQLNKAVIDVKLVDVLAPSGVDGGSEESMSDSQSPMSLQEAEAIVDDSSREWAGDGFSSNLRKTRLGTGKTTTALPRVKVKCSICATNCDHLH
jgi:hypothetical protein